MWNDWHVFKEVLFINCFQGSFGKVDTDPACEMREESYDEVVYDELMKCQKNVEKKCFMIQETTFNVYKVSSITHYLLDKSFLIYFSKNWIIPFLLQ
jgi:hypothetical protein